MMSDKQESTLSIIAALVALFTAMIAPRPFRRRGRFVYWWILPSTNKFW
ncbi:MAG: hypothetical protein R6X34_17125 [Chloroflexota bacterium]